MKRAFIFLLLSLGASCGGGGGSSPEPPPDECKKDSDCDDGVECTRDICYTSVLGVLKCQHEPRDEMCGPNGRCIIAQDPSFSGCYSEEQAACLGKPDGSPCEVSLPCSDGPGRCKNRVCQYPKKTCDPLPCAKSLGCDDLSGECKYEPLEDGSPCTYPFDPCRPAVCDKGECKPKEGPLCDDENPCTVDTCKGNTCEHSLLKDGTPCDDKDPCTEGETCEKGLCQGGHPRICDDANDCTSDSCDPQKGGCLFEPLPDGSPCFEAQNLCRPGLCTKGLCLEVKDLDCDDNNPCTEDLCNPKEGCLHNPLSGIPCDDNNACTSGDMCEAGTCLSGEPLVCDDHNPCTDDTCNPSTGCVFTTLENCCGNGILEEGESCDAGPLGSQGCGTDCHYKLVALTGPGEGGLYPSVAWSSATGSGLVAYELASSPPRLMVRTIAKDLSVGEPRVIYEYSSSDVRGVAIVATPDGPSDFLLATADFRDVHLFALDKEGTVISKYLKAWKMSGEVIFFPRIRIGRLGSGRFVVGFSDTIPCPGKSPRVVARVATADLGKGEFSEPILVGNVACEGKSATLFGEVCDGNGGGIVTLAQMAGYVPGVGNVSRDLIITFGPEGLSNPITFWEFNSDMPLPPVCSASADGLSFLVVLWDMVQSKNLFRVLSFLTGKDGGKLGGPFTVEEVSGGSSLPPICFTSFSRSIGLSDGNFFLLCTRYEMGQEYTPVSGRLMWLTFDKTGKPKGTFQQFEPQEMKFAFEPAIALIESRDPIVAFWEADSGGNNEDFPFTLYPANLRLVGFDLGLGD